MRIALAVLMALHGVAHLPGFVGSWRLAALEGMPYRTTVLAGRVDLGDAGMRAVGVLWLVAAAGFCLAAVGAATDRAWWTPLAVTVSLLSLTLSVLAWPESRIGVPVNLVVLTTLLIGARAGWLAA